MEHRALENSATASSSTIPSMKPREGRNVWVLTAYGISGLALMGVLAYYLSGFLTH